MADAAAPVVPLLAARGISKNFAGVEVLRDVDLDLMPGEIHALLGENGAGKSTFSKILAGVYRPSRGTLALNALVPAAFAQTTPVETQMPDPARGPHGGGFLRMGCDANGATDLQTRLPALPALPSKVGVAIDAGPYAVLTDAPADVRVERGETGELILRADGRTTGVALPPGGEAAAVVALLDWFLASGGAASGRMARHRVGLPGWATGMTQPAPGPRPTTTLPFLETSMPGLISTSATLLRARLLPSCPSRHRAPLQDIAPTRRDIRTCSPAI